MPFPILASLLSDWSSYYHFNYSGYRWRLLRDGRRWRSPSFSIASWPCRSEERFSRNAETDLVCRLLLEKKNKAFARFEVSIFDELIPTDSKPAVWMARTVDALELMNS